MHNEDRSSLQPNHLPERLKWFAWQKSFSFSFHQSIKNRLNMYHHHGIKLLWLWKFIECRIIFNIKSVKSQFLPRSRQCLTYQLKAITL